MKNNPFKAFHIFEVPQSTLDGVLAIEAPDLDLFASRDPVGASWRSIGLVAPYPGSTLIEISAQSAVLMFQFNERILPGKVRDEKVAERVVKLADQVGRKVSKKEYAQLREEVELELLPKAFIRRSLVPVVFTSLDDGRPAMIVFSGSPKKAEDTVGWCSFIMNHEKQQVLPRGVEFKCRLLQTAASLRAGLKTLAEMGKTEVLDEAFFVTTAVAVLKGEEKRTIRVKDRDIEGHEVQALIKQGYAPGELGLALVDSDADERARFTLTDKFVFKSFAVAEKQMGEEGTDLHAFSFIVIRTVREIMGVVSAEWGGWLDEPYDDADAHQAAMDAEIDDDPDAL